MTIAYSVALCTYNRSDRLRRTLDDLLQIRTPQAAWELLVIDNGCRDQTPELLAHYPWPDGWQVRIAQEKRLGLSSARNRAIMESRGKYVIFIDDDETPNPDWLCAYEHLLGDKEPDAFGGPIRLLFEDPRPNWLSDELLSFLGQVNRSEQVTQLTDPHACFYGGNFGFKRSICGRVGTFDCMLGRKGNVNNGGEEEDFYRRLLAAGLKVWWTPSATVTHRIHADKLRRSYFLDLSYREGSITAVRCRRDASRLPPRYFYAQLLVCLATGLKTYLQHGYNASLRKQMIIAYALGQLIGWAFGPRC